MNALSWKWKQNQGEKELFMVNEAVKEYVYVLIRLLRKTGVGYNDIAIEAGLSYQKIKDIANHQSLTISLDTIKRIEKYALKVAVKEDK